MAYIQDYFDLVSVKKTNASCYDYIIYCPEIVKLAKAGQFLHIRCGEKTLRRPISICEINKSDGTIRIVFDIRGEGTHWLAQKQVGEKLDILGPLGNGFDLNNTNKKALFVGGGIGVPPLLEAAKNYRGTADAILGFKCSDCAVLIEDFKKECAEVDITSDDGSLGDKGFVTSIFIKKMLTKKYDIIYACGPTPMLKAVSEIVAVNETPCFVSLEERMGCGVGACLVCACKIKSNNGMNYKHVCKDGPVFNAEEVVW